MKKIPIFYHQSATKCYLIKGIRSIRGSKNKNFIIIVAHPLTYIR